MNKIQSSGWCKDPEIGGQGEFGPASDGAASNKAHGDEREVGQPRDVVVHDGRQFVSALGAESKTNNSLIQTLVLIVHLGI